MDFLYRAAVIRGISETRAAVGEDAWNVIHEAAYWAVDAARETLPGSITLLVTRSDGGYTQCPVDVYMDADRVTRFLYDRLNRVAGRGPLGYVPGSETEVS